MSPFNLTTSSSYNIASVPRVSGGSSCINTIAFNLWQPINSPALPEFHAGDPGVNSGGLPGSNTTGDNTAFIAAQAALSVGSLGSDNPILSSNLVRKAMFEGFNRAQAAINDTGVATAVGGPVDTARMADSIYNGLWYQANRTTTAAHRTSVCAQITLAVSTNTEIPIDESVTFRVTRSVCQGLNNQNTGLFVETAYCSG